MKKMLACILCLLMFVTPFASANPFVNSSKPAGMWSVNDCKNLVGEDVFMAMVTEAKQNIYNAMKDELEIGFDYAPTLYAIADSLRAANLNPDEVLYRLGDSDAALEEYLTILKERGYISNVPSVYNEEVEAAIKKLQYASGLPTTGELTLTIAHSLKNGMVFPDNEQTLETIIESVKLLEERCGYEMNLAVGVNEDLHKYSYETVDSDFMALIECLAAAITAYDQAHTYIPSSVVEYSMYAPLNGSFARPFNNENDEEQYNIAANTSALLSVVFFCAQYEFAHEAAEYTAEYYDLTK